MTIMTRGLLSLLLLLACSGLTFAQNANELWTEDFSEGIPDGWTNEDLNGFDAVFTWCADPNTGQADGCPRLWDDNTNLQTPFASETVNNGFISMDSDLIGQIAGNHLTQLTTDAISVADAEEVWFSMQTHIGVYTIDAVNGAILRVSTDEGENWTDFVLFPNLTTGERWSENPASPVVNISEAAAGSENIWLQFQWEGSYEYHWSMDDMVLYDGDPRFDNDLQVDKFYAIAPNYSYPEGQLEPFGFLADVSNVGAQTQTDINLSITIAEDGTEVFSADLAYEPIPIDSTVENVLFAEQFTPAGEAGTVYTGTYEVSAAVTDENPENNTRTFEFVVSDTLFAKAPEIDATITPAFNDGENDFQWAYGAHYHVVNGDGLYARTMSFGITGDEDNAGQDILAVLYKVTDDGDAEGFRLVTPEERGNPIGLAFYTIQGDEVHTDVISLPITDLAGNPVPLEDDADYLAMVEVPVTGEIRVVMGANRSISYDAQDLIMDNAGLFRFTQVLAIGDDISSEDYSTFGFAGDVTPFVNLSIGSILSNTDNIMSADNVVNVSPNPANNIAVLSMDLAEVSERATVHIYNTKGQVVGSQDLRNVQNTQTELDIKDLAEGMYFVRLTTEAGVTTRSLVIAR